jgi:hypothetical protein
MKNLDIRWMQRFENFSKAYDLLAEIESQNIDDMPAIVREGFIQRFEYTFDADKFEQALMKLKNEYLPQIHKVRKYFASKRLSNG